MSNVCFELHYPVLWLLADGAAQNTHGHATLVRLNSAPRSDSLENLTRCSLAGKSGAQYAILGCVAAAAVLSVYALVRAMRAPGLRLIFILVGFGKLAVDCSTGVLSLKLPALQLCSAAALAPLYRSWSVAVCLPLGALVFLLRPHNAPAAAASG